MTAVIQFKRRVGSAGTPTALAEGEPAFHDPGGGPAELYIGTTPAGVLPLVSPTRQVEITGTQTITGQKTFSPTSFKLTGGTANYVLQTDGSGNLSWVPQTAPPDLSGYAPLASPTFTGDPKAPTPATSDNDTSIATTAFVKAQGYLVSTDLSAYAPLASPTFTGDPKAPTPATADNDTSIATTAFVKAQGYVTGGPFQPLDGDLTAIAALAGINTIYYRSAADTWTAVTIGSGLTFTSGTLDAPTFSSIAKGEVPASGGGTVNFLRADGIWAAPAGGGNVNTSGSITTGDLARWASATSIQSYPIATLFTSPAFTGTPTAPTQAANDNSTKIATTAWVRSRAGVTDGSSAAAGVVGEVIQSKGSQSGQAPNVWVSMASISLTAGEWEVSGWAMYWMQSGTTGFAIQCCASLSPNSGSPLGASGEATNSGYIYTPHIYYYPITPTTLRLTGNQVIYINQWHNNPSDPIVYQAFIRARRVR